MGSNDYTPRPVLTISDTASNPFFAQQSEAIYITDTAPKAYQLVMPSQPQAGPTNIAAGFIVFQGGSAKFGVVNLSFSFAGKAIVSLPIGIQNKFQQTGPQVPAVFLTQVPDGDPGLLDVPIPYNGPPGVPPMLFQWYRPDWPLGNPVNGIIFPMKINFTFDTMTLSTTYVNTNSTDSICAGAGLAAFTF